MYGLFVFYGYLINCFCLSGLLFMGMGGGFFEFRYFWYEVCNLFGLDVKDDSVNVDCLEVDWWFEFMECFL